MPFLVAALAGACAAGDRENTSETPRDDLLISSDDQGDLSMLAESGKLSPELLEQMVSGIDRANLFSTELPTYRVVVNLQPQIAARALPGISSQEAMAIQRSDVRRVQDRVISTFADDELDINSTYENIHAFSAEVTGDKLVELVSSDDVSYIEVMPVLLRQDAEAHAITGVNQVLQSGITGKGAVIAVIDDGIDHDHPAFGGQSSFPNNKILGGFDFGDNDADPTIDCLDQSHGTAVAGVAAGNGGGVVGTAPDAKLVFLKVQRRSECGQPSLSGDIIGALDWAVSNRDAFDIDIVSMSLGGSVGFNSAASCDASNRAYKSVVDVAQNIGLTVVAASGNSALDSRISAPACVSGIISVGATYDVDIGGVRFGNCEDPSTGPDQVTCYSNSASYLDILAPSHCALTAAPGGGQEDCFGGTSSATPYTSGVLASLLEIDPNLSPAELRDLVTSTGTPIRDDRNGLVKPRVNAAAAHAKLADGGTGGGGGGGGGGGNPSIFPILESNLSMTSGQAINGTFEIPAGTGAFILGITGGTGDADLYVRKGAAPTVFQYDCRPYRNGNEETCAFNDNAGGTYHVMIRPFRSNVSGLTFFGEKQ